MLIRMAITRSKRSLQTTTVEETTKRQKTTVTTEKVEKVETVQKKPALEPPSTPKKKRPPVPQVELDHSAPQAEPAGRAGLLPEFVKGLDHCIKVDPSLKPIIDKSAFTTFDQERIAREEKLSSFGYLVRSIIGQQISGAAARSVLLKFLAVFGLSSSNNEQRTAFPTPRQVLDKSTETLRGAGLSARKVEYVQGIASAYERGELSDEILKTSNDDDVVDMLVALKGIGPWSADMFLLFYLHRMDTFAVGDLGVQRGVSVYIKERAGLQDELKQVDWSLPLEGLHSPGKSAKSQQRKPAKLPPKNGGGKWKVPQANEMLYIANKFKPYRSVFEILMWRLSDTNLAVLADSEDKNNVMVN